MQLTDLIGYIRDLTLAVLALLIAFGVDLTDAQIAGIVGVLLAVGGFTSYVYSRWGKGDGTPAGASK